jgi:hypothetical protein
MGTGWPGIHCVRATFSFDRQNKRTPRPNISGSFRRLAKVIIFTVIPRIVRAPKAVRIDTVASRQEHIIGPQDEKLRIAKI